MLEVAHVVKQYGGFTALDDLSFALEKGQVLGFLGRNGAGKSTAMNIITGCLAPTAGRVLFEGEDIRGLGSAYLSQIGYLPEIPPLYPDLTVEEYLSFVYGMKKLRQDQRRNHIREACEMTRVEDKLHKPIRSLSKGYRQRVGLCQALLGNPPLLILDEPTVGLDPEQMVLIRQLVRELGREHAVLLSSHILSEIEDVCTTLVILRKGKVVAAGTLGDIAATCRRDTCKLAVRLQCEGAEDALRQLPGVVGVTRLTAKEQGYEEFLVETGADVTALLPEVIAARGGHVRMMYPMDVELEDLFLHLTAEEGERDAQRDRT